MALRQGQHIRLRTNGSKFFTHSLDLTFHISSTTENSTTKDTTDTTGMWNEYEKTQYAVDGSVSGIVTTGSDTGGMTIAEIKTAFQTEKMAWDLVLTGGDQNRKAPSGGTGDPQIICSGQKLTFSNVEVQGPKDGYAQFTANFQIFGGVTVPTT